MTVAVAMLFFLMAMSVSAVSLEQVHNKVCDATSRDTKTK
jgi:hypothetical protein